MRYILIIVILFSISNLKSQEIQTEYWKNKKKRTEGKMSSTGKEVGLWKYWDKSGNLVRETEYYLGLPNGRVTYYYIGGIKENEGFFKRGFKEGKYSEWTKTLKQT